MTGRERIAAGLSAEGSPQFAAVTNYQSITLRDHWEQCTDAPWWVMFETDPARAAQPWIQMVRRTDEDWFVLRAGHSRQTREDTAIEVEGEAVWQVNHRTGERWQLQRPPIGGEQTPYVGEAVRAGCGVRTREQLEAVLPPIPEPPSGSPSDDGTLDLPNLLLAELGGDRMPIAHVGTPLWMCYGLWGFEEMMTRLVDTPELVQAACDHYLRYCLVSVQRAAAIGVKLIWIEDCMTDMISPAQFRALHLPALRPMAEAIREAGMLSVHYFCGRPDDRLDLLLDTGADALSLEESKKTFAVDIMELAEFVDGRMALLGNLDAIALMEHGSEAALQAEVARQCTAGVRNRHRFVASLGSPVTPGTPISRVRRYCDLVHDWDGSSTADL